jgi:hypothetical protein
MTNLFRSTVALAALALAAAPAAAANPDRNATATTRIVKPLTLTWVDDLDLGTIILGGTGAWTGAVIGVDQNGALSCTNSNVTCSGAYKEARYKVTGTNNQTVTISAPNVQLVNQFDPTKTLWLVTSAPASVALGNSGSVGLEFGVGGAITVDSTTADGTYSGTLNVTVNY